MRTAKKEGWVGFKVMDGNILGDSRRKVAGEEKN